MSRRRQDVRVWNVQDRRGSGRNVQPWVVRWVVDGKQSSRSFRSRALADRFRASILLAHDDGEEFDRSSGEPVTWTPLPGDTQIHQWARRWLADQWTEWQPRTRRSAVEALVKFVPLVVSSQAPEPPPGMRAHLKATLEPGADIDPQSAAERWLQKWSLPLTDLNRERLSTIDLALGVGLDGSRLAPSTAGRFRKVSRSCIRRAVDLEILPTDPWPPVSRGRLSRKSTRSKPSFDIRTLPDPATMRRALRAMETQQAASRTYQVMTAVAYYAGLRPSEVVMLRASSLRLSRSGWGRIDVTEADVLHDEPGEPKTGARSVPIPPVLVAELSAWVRDLEPEPEDLLFRTRTGKMPTLSNWLRAWHRALGKIDHAPLRLYDCRHAAATTWLRAGVPLGEVARRLGHSVETLVSTYVGALEGDEAIANARIDAELAQR
jgi:integrase